MGRKPVLGLVGACLTGMALAGCADNCCLWDKSPKKDTTLTTSSSPAGGTARTDNGWRDQRFNSTAGSTFNNGGTAGAAGTTTTAGTTGGSPYNPGTSSAYPSGSSNATNSFDRGSPHTTTGPDVTGGRATQPTNYNEATTGGGSPSPSTFPPMAGPGPARPRVDDLPGGKSSHGPAIDAPPALPPVSSSASSPAGLPRMSAGPDVPAPGAKSSFDGLPPVSIPTPASQKGLERTALPPPAPPPVSDGGLPALPQKPATMPN